MVEIGKKIRELREAKKMSQKELAKLLNITPQAVSKWELDKSLPDLETLVKLCDYFQISIDQLLGNSKKSFFESLFSRKKGNKIMEDKKLNTTNGNGEVPKAVKVVNASSFLKITFDNGETRYLRSHFNRDFVDAFSPSKGKGKRALLFGGNMHNWIGTEIKIEDDGTVILNEKDIYTPEELWNDSREHVDAL